MKYIWNNSFLNCGCRLYAPQVDQSWNDWVFVWNAKCISIPRVSIYYYYYYKKKTQQNNNKQICSPSPRSWRLAVLSRRAIEILAEPSAHLLRPPAELGPCGLSGLGTNLVDPSIKMAASSKRSLYNPAPSQTPPPQIRYFELVWKIISYSLSYFKASMS